MDTNNFGTYQEPDMSESVSASGERPTVTREGFITLTIDDAKVNSDTSE
uniref:Uncharacterized protein n=1 Tax=uncultured bacterium contig00042 TaxID=1181529 RepID=A0A806KHU8_9BACT|nr:hypothetical protein [uncultured bacterium contig00042]